MGCCNSTRKADSVPGDATPSKQQVDVSAAGGINTSSLSEKDSAALQSEVNEGLRKYLSARLDNTISHLVDPSAPAPVSARFSLDQSVVESAKPPPSPLKEPTPAPVVPLAELQAKAAEEKIEPAAEQAVTAAAPIAVVTPREPLPTNFSLFGKDEFDEKVVNRVRGGYRHGSAPSIVPSYDAGVGADVLPQVLKQLLALNKHEEIDAEAKDESLPQLIEQALQSTLQWNALYQANFDNAPVSLIHQQSSYAHASIVVSAFQAFARHVASIILRELTVPTASKTIRAVDAAGKYKAGGVTFRWVRDVDNVFGGQGFAAKSASNELRANQAVLALASRLRTPLSAVFRYRGQCIIASADAPVDDSTLVYGSADGGQTVQNDSPTLEVEVATVARALNVKEHRVLNRSDIPVVLYTAGDSQGHHTKTDGRMYLLELARLFPAVPPPSNSPTEINYYQFRPEFLSKYSASSVSSDVFSRWGRSEAGQHNAEARLAFASLLSAAIPELALNLRDLMRGSSQFSPAQLEQGAKELPFLFHLRGVNMRYLHLVRAAIPVEPEQGATADDLVLRRLLLQEMCARAVKTRLRKIWSLVDSDDEAYVEMARHVLLPLFNRSADIPTEVRELSWRVLESDLQQKYVSAHRDGLAYNPLTDVYGASAEDVAALRAAVTQDDEVATLFALQLIRGCELRWESDVHASVLADVELDKLTITMKERVINVPAPATIDDLEVSLLREAEDRARDRGSAHVSVLGPLLTLIKTYTLYLPDQNVAFKVDGLASRIAQVIEANTLTPLQPAQLRLLIADLIAIAEAYVRIKSIDAAEICYRKAVQLGLAELPPSDMILARALAGSVSVLKMACRFHEAAIFNAAIAAVLEGGFARTAPPTPQHTPATLYERAMILARNRLDSGDFPAAVQWSNWAVQSTVDGSELNVTASVLLAETHRQSGDLHEASDTCSKVILATLSNPTVWASFARSSLHQELYLCHRGSKNWLAASNALRLALNAARLAFGPFSLEVATLELEYGVLYWAETAEHRNSGGNLTTLPKDKFNAAVSHVLTAIDICRNTVGVFHELCGSAENLLGMIYRASVDLSNAQFHLKRALVIQSESLGPYDTRTAASLTNLASVLRDQGSFAESKSMYERAFEIFNVQQDLPAQNAIKQAINYVDTILDRIVLVDTADQIATIFKKHFNVASKIQQYAKLPAVQQIVLFPDRVTFRVSTKDGSLAGVVADPDGLIAPGDHVNLTFALLAPEPTLGTLQVKCPSREDVTSMQEELDPALYGALTQLIESQANA